MCPNEPVAHAFDLAVATDQADRLDEGLAAAALEGAKAMLGPEYRDAMGNGEPCGVEVPAPDDATTFERLAAFTGRAPR